VVLLFSCAALGELESSPESGESPERKPTEVTEIEEQQVDDKTSEVLDDERNQAVLYSKPAVTRLSRGAAKKHKKGVLSRPRWALNIITVRPCGRT
jgi:hypothetical protein